MIKFEQGKIYGCLPENSQAEKDWGYFSQQCLIEIVKRTKCFVHYRKVQADGFKSYQVYKSKVDENEYDDNYGIWHESEVLFNAPGAYPTWATNEISDDFFKRDYNFN